MIDKCPISIGYCLVHDFVFMRITLRGKCSYSELFLSEYEHFSRSVKDHIILFFTSIESLVIIDIVTHTTDCKKDEDISSGNIQK